MDREVEVHVGALPRCWADPALFQQVFSNLLGNAFKFTRSRGAARIEVGCALVNGESVYVVRDNGIGFDQEHVDRVFNVFERLHETDEYEGTGIGLSIVKRIVERHGGRVWAEGKVGEGAAFYFTIEPGTEGGVGE